MNGAKSSRPVAQGFTLVELLTVIVIVAVLAVIATVATGGFIEKGKKVRTMAQFRDFQVGMTLFEGDYERPPVFKEKRDSGWDTIYGDPGGDLSNQFLVSVLAGEDKDYPYQGRNFSTREANPRAEYYMTFPLAPDNKGGVGKDGKLYDPWGREIMVAINGFNAPGHAVDDYGSPLGQNDRYLNTFGFGEYTETKPKFESYVFWSYGKDGKKGKNGPNYWDKVPLAGSDDVISW